MIKLKENVNHFTSGLATYDHDAKTRLIYLKEFHLTSEKDWQIRHDDIDNRFSTAIQGRSEEEKV